MKTIVLLTSAVGLCTTATTSFAVATESCGAASVSSGKQASVVAGKQHPLHVGPSAKAEQIVNVKATQVIGKRTLASIDNSTVVVEECTQAGWSRVRVTEPEWLRDSHIGWVPSSVLRVRGADGGYTRFSEEDFTWNSRTRAHKKTIIDGVNRIHRENGRCKKIDPSSVDVSSTKGTASNPVFFVTCGETYNVFNVFFSKSEVESGANMAAAKHIDREKAIGLCAQAARSKANHPSTVNFSYAARVTDHPNGRTTVMSTFTARNSFNLETKHSIRCLLNSAGLMEAHVNEAQ